MTLPEHATRKFIGSGTSPFGGGRSHSARLRQRRNRTHSRSLAFIRQAMAKTVTSGGLAALARKSQSGRPRKLDNAQRQELKTAILAGAKAAGYPVEPCWNHVKHVCLPNFVPTTAEELLSTTDQATKRINEEKLLPSLCKLARPSP